MIRDAVKQLLEARGVVVGLLAGDGDAVKGFIARRACSLVILGLSMPRGGLPLVEDLHRLHPKLPLVVFSAQGERDWAVRAIAAGASAFVPKSDPLEELDNAVTHALAGRHHVSPHVAELLINRAVGHVASAEEPHERLSTREFEVFERIVEGQSLAEIAATLRVSPKTVTTYRARVLAKLEVTNNSELVLYAVYRGLAHE